jgi:hypothetical protein
MQAQGNHGRMPNPPTDTHGEQMNDQHTSLVSQALAYERCSVCVLPTTSTCMLMTAGVSCRDKHINHAVRQLVAVLFMTTSESTQH